MKSLCTAEDSLFGAVDSGHASEAAQRAGSLSLCAVCIEKAKGAPSGCAIACHSATSQRPPATPRTAFRDQERPAPVPSTPCTPTVLLTSATLAGTAPDITAISSGDESLAPARAGTEAQLLAGAVTPPSGGEEQVCTYVLKRWSRKALERPPSSHSPHVLRTFSTWGCVAQLRVQATAAADLLCPLCRACFCSGCSAQGWTDRHDAVLSASLCPAVHAHPHTPPQGTHCAPCGGRLHAPHV